MLPRSSGVLMHPTSLPGPHGIGDLGPEAYEFADFLAETKQRIWQLLPLTPTALTSHNDPYHSVSAFAGNPLLLSLDFLAKDGLLTKKDISKPPQFPEDTVDFKAATAWKQPLLAKAAAAFDPDAEPDFHRFCTKNDQWLDNYALFTALRDEQHGALWNTWPAPLSNRHKRALAAGRKRLAAPILHTKILQYLFHQQWESLRAYCAKRSIFLFGDMPIYVDLDSADVWAEPTLWKLDAKKQQTAQAGVPPDYFSATGQLWESPVYDWPKHQGQDFHWWLSRIHRNLALFDFLRIDHFRGLVAYWEVPAKAKTAINGKWIPAPVNEFLDTLHTSRPTLPLIAEDLGVITPDVREAMDRYDYPGMKILLFAFGEDLPTNPYAPHNIPKHSVVYTGTHDNNPTQAWYDEEADAHTRDRLASYLGRKPRRESLHWDMIRLASQTRADLAVYPVQDLLGLGAQARMNRPGNLKGNWDWRMRKGALKAGVKRKLKELTLLSGRG